MITITPNLATKAATLDARIAAGEQVTLRLPGAADGGLTLSFAAPGGAIIASADGVVRDGGTEFDLDTDTAEALAATSGRPETACLLLIGRAEAGSRQLLVRQPVSIYSWPRPASDLPPAPLPDTVAQRLAALEGGKLDKSGGAGGYAFSVENGVLVLTDAGGYRFQFTNGWDGNDVARLWDTAGGGGGYALVDGGDLTEEGQSLYPADRAVTKWACAGYAGANLTPPDERYDGAVRDFIVDFDNTSAGASDFTVTLDSGYDYIAVGGELELTVAGGEYRTFYFSERPGGVFAVASAALAAPGSGSRSAAAASGGLERGSLLEPVGRESLGELERETVDDPDAGEEPDAETEEPEAEEEEPC